MPTDPLLGFEDPSDPGFKIVRGTVAPGGRSPGVSSPPPGIVGGGYGSFFGSPTAGSVTYSYSPRRPEYGAVPGFKPWMDPGAGSSLMPGADEGSAPSLEEIMALLQQIQHFAAGGWVQPAGVRRMAAPGGRPAIPAQQTVGATPKVGAAPIGGGMTTEQQGGWGWNPQNVPGYMNIGDNPLYRRLTEMLGQYGASGAFSPTGSPAVMSAVKENALGNADAVRQRAGTLAVLSGADPASRANYMLQSDLASQGGAAKAMNDAVLGQLVGAQDFGRSLLGTGLSANMQDYLARLAYEHQRLLK